MTAPGSPMLVNHSPRALREVLARQGDDLDLLADLVRDARAFEYALRSSLENIDSGEMRATVRECADGLRDLIGDTIGAYLESLRAAEEDAKPMMRADVPASAQ